MTGKGGDDAERSELEHQVGAARAHEGYRRTRDRQEPETDACVDGERRGARARRG